MAKQIEPKIFTGTSVTSEQMAVRIAELRRLERETIDEIVARENTGATPTSQDATDNFNAVRAEAKRLMNGEFGGAMPAEGAGLTLDELFKRRDAIKLAISEAGRIQGMQAKREADQRVAENMPRYSAVMSEVAQCVIALERALQARDLLTRELRPASLMPGDGFTFAGRLTFDSPARRFLEHATRHGWLKTAELESEIHRAKECTG